MCGDTDPDGIGSAKVGACFFFGPTFGFDPISAIVSPTTTSTTVSEVVVTAHRPDRPLEVIPPVQITLMDWSFQLPPEIIINLPWIDNLTLPTQATPCVQRSPAGVSLQDINDQMYTLSRTVISKFQGNGNEWGGAVYQSSDGSLHQSAPFTGGMPDSMDGARIQLPDGARVVAYLHTHPYTGFDQTYPSPNTQGAGNDEDFVNGLASGGRGNSDLVTFIATPIDASNSDVRVYAYDRDHLHNPGTGCELRFAS